MKRTILTPEQAQAISDAFEIQTMLDNEEEHEMLLEWQTDNLEGLFDET